MHGKHVFIVVPALNEVANIEKTVAGVADSAAAAQCNVSMLLINDGSTDGTGALMDSLAQRYPRVQVIHRPARAGLSRSFHDGIERADAPYLTVIPGDNAFAQDGIRRILSAAGEADMVVSYRQDQARSRNAARYVLSRLFTVGVGILFGRRLRDFHGMVLYPVDLLRRADLRAEGPAYQIEAIVRLLRQKPTVIEVPVTLNPQPALKSSSLRLKVLGQLIRTVIDLTLRR